MWLGIEIISILLVGITALPADFQKPQRYDNYAVYKVHIENAKQRDIISGLLNNINMYNLWHNGLNEIHIMVHPQELINFQKVLKTEGLRAQLLIRNVQTLIDGQSIRRKVEIK